MGYFMKEWNELDLDKIEKNEIKTMTDNTLDNALVVISNLIARATTKWSLEETKLFLCSVTKVRMRDSENWVTLSKKDVVEKLSIDPTNRSKLRDMFKKMMQKSYVQFDGPSEDEWEDGFLLINVRSTKKEISVKFNEVYLPLLDRLSSHFTEFYLDYVKDFTRMSSYNLYVFLCSWHDPDYLIQNKKIKKSELHKVFNLKENDYWRNYGTENAKFHWADFEKYVLNPAIEEINNLAKEGQCDMYIESCDKVKKSTKNVLGYDIRYSFIGKDGCRK
ncbi:hypothetical protein C815_02340 [Firmicutes bacterium M10-2]|nr:hypothetical protein C815_02340 [Firmicutes bacterium M10-2]